MGEGKCLLESGEKQWHEQRSNDGKGDIYIYIYIYICKRSYIFLVIYIFKGYVHIFMKHFIAHLAST